MQASSIIMPLIQVEEKEILFMALFLFIISPDTFNIENIVTN